jgi:hypothetical protein
MIRIGAGNQSMKYVWRGKQSEVGGSEGWWEEVKYSPQAMGYNRFAVEGDALFSFRMNFVI